MDVGRTDFIRPTQDSRQVFSTLVRSALDGQEFRARLSALLDRDPYFIPAYLEHAWLAEMRGDIETVRAILGYAHRAVLQVMTNSAARAYVNDTWTALEYRALHELFDTLRNYDRSLVALPLIYIERRFATHYLVSKSEARRAEQFLKWIKRVDVTSVQQELQGAAPYWWNVATGRAEALQQHKHTHAIVLRRMPDISSIEYASVDGVHESTPALPATRFPVAHQTILSLADALGIALGRVAFVRLPPHAQTYRHYDHEPHYVGRQRYHLVVKAGLDNVLSSGDEIAKVHVGDLWFFENKVMHRAHNKSNVSRTHIIFDGYPL